MTAVAEEVELDVDLNAEVPCQVKAEHPAAQWSAILSCCGQSVAVCQLCKDEMDAAAANPLFVFQFALLMRCKKCRASLDITRVTWIRL